MLPALEVLEKAGPRRFTAGDVSARKAWRLVEGVIEVSPVGNKERGVKNRRNDRGVTVGGFLVLRVSEAIDGGDEGGSGGGRTGSDRGTSGILEMSIVCLTKKSRKKIERLWMHWWLEDSRLKGIGDESGKLDLFFVSRRDAIVLRRLRHFTPSTLSISNSFNPNCSSFLVIYCKLT